MPALRIKLPNAGELTHHLVGERVTIGRAADNTIQIPHGSVSAHHAEIVKTDGTYCLHDLHSTNRSYVNGQAVAELTLTGSCTIRLGSIECEFDPLAELPRRQALPLPATAGAETDATFLESENRHLRDRVHSLQRRFDILGSARLVTGNSDLSPYAAADEVAKALTAERDELRQENAGLHLQLEHVGEELVLTARERDAARQAAETLQAERTALRRELEQTRARADRLQTAPAPAPAPSSTPPPRPSAAAPLAPPPPPAGVAPRTAPAAPADCALLPAQVRVLSEVVAQLSAAPAEPALLTRAGEAITQVCTNAAPLGHHAFRRIARGLREFIGELRQRTKPPETLPIRTVRHAVELLTRLLEPPLFDKGRDLPAAQVLVIDDDPDLLATVTSALINAGMRTTGCESAEAGLIALEAQHFDAIITDVRLPAMKGPAFCAHARDLPAYRRTPIIFLTVADTLDQRAETSLSGGNEFIAKPFTVAELALKVQSWALKQQLQMP